MSQSILQNGYAILLANTSDMDKYLLAKDQLLTRLMEIKDEKTKARDEAISDRQSQIEKINLYVAKLMVGGASISEIEKYTTLKSQLELQVIRLNSQNIHPTYDDVRRTHAFFVNTTFRPLVSVAYGYSTVNTTPLPLFGSSTRLKIPLYGDFITDQAIHLRISSLTATHEQNRVRWFDFIGHRIIKEVRLVMDGVVLDRYGSEEMEMYFRFHVSQNQRIGWMRCVGQETPRQAIFIQDPENQLSREYKLIYDGFQTPKQTHGKLDLYIPLLFWYNLDPGFAISNWNMTYDKFWIEIDFTTIDECTTIIDYAGDGGKFVEPKIIACDLVTNHVYTTPEVAELFKRRSQFSVVRIHKRVDRILNKAFDMVNIGDIKLAVESLYIRFRPVANDSDENRAETWRVNDVSTYSEIQYASIISLAGTTSLAYTPAYYYQSSPIMDTISLISNDSVIYDPSPGLFYNSYIPLRFGGERVITPSDEGAFLMTFSMFPGEAQPSGYLNFSHSRDQYISYVSSFIDIDNPVTMSVCATCINFLVMTDGGLSMRYAT
jgi:hypothetical protein